VTKSSQVRADSAWSTVTSTRRVAAAGMIGSAVEWYDFYLYGTASALIFNELFFSNLSPATGVLATFATYTVGILARPLGAIAAGHLGDRHGRKPVLVWSLFMMGIASALIGVLPTYAQVGLLAPALLTLLRLLQGFAVGGEQGGAAVLMIESSSANRRGFWGSVVMSGSSAGLLLASGAFAATRALLTDEQFLDWGWRALFLTSVILIVVGVVIRISIHEPDEFVAARRDNQLSRSPLRSVVGKHRRNLTLAIGMRISQTAASYFFTVFVLFYLEYEVPEYRNIGVVAVTTSAALSLVTGPLWGALSDRLGRRRLFLAGAISSALYIVPFFLIVDTHSPVLIFMGILLGLNIFHDAMFGPLAAWFSELFPMDVRYSGTSIAYQIGPVLGGGLLPLIATSLFFLGGSRPWLISTYLLVLSATTITAAILTPETRGRFKVQGQ
jgi:MHS family shikimate/dehydroshikimate transporter-like MFS transporter